MVKQHIPDELHLPATQTFWAPLNAPHREIRTTLNSRVAYAPHLHQYLSLGLILQGETRLTCAEETLVVQQHDMVTLEPMLVHSCNPVLNQPRSYHMLYLDPLWIAQQLFYAENKASCLHVCQRTLQNRSLSEALHDAIEQAHSEGSTPSDAAIRRLETAICRVLEVSCTLEEKDSVQAEPLAETAQLFVTEDSPTPVAEMALMAGLSREGFIRAFRRTTGLTPGKYGHCLRIEEGRRLLRLGCSIVEAALATGYADQSHFHRTFVRYCAATPRQYAREWSLLFKKG